MKWGYSTVSTMTMGIDCDVMGRRSDGTEIKLYDGWMAGFRLNNDVTARGWVRCYPHRNGLGTDGHYVRIGMNFDRTITGRD